MSRYPVTLDRRVEVSQSQIKPFVCQIRRRGRGSGRLSPRIFCGTAWRSGSVDPIHRVSLMKRWGLGTCHGLRREHIDSYPQRICLPLQSPVLSAPLIRDRPRPGLASPPDELWGHRRPRQPSQGRGHRPEPTAVAQDGGRKSTGRFGPHRKTPSNNSLQQHQPGNPRSWETWDNEINFEKRVVSEDVLVLIFPAFLTMVSDRNPNGS
jgi:hypothetical protein